MKQLNAHKLYARDLHAFVEKAFRFLDGKRLSDDQQYIRLVIHHLQQFLAGDITKLLVNLPGRHLKTIICSVCFPAFALGLDPSLKFMIVAYNEDLAEDIVRKIREVMESPWYKKAFQTRISDGHSRKDDFTIVGGGRVRAVPVRSVTGKGGDIIILDDPHNVADWDNDRQKEKVVEAFELLVSRRDGGQMSKMLVVGHRIAEDDLSAHILDRGDFDHLCLPLFAPKKMSFDLDGERWTLSKGEALRPDAFPPEEIASIRKNHRGPPYWLYYQQGLGPRCDDFQLDVSHFPFLGRGALGEVFAANVPVVLSVDPSQKTESGSRNVIHVYAVRGNNYDFLQAFAEKCSFNRLARKVKKFATLYGASLILVENTARGPDLIDSLRLDLSIEVEPVNPRGSKADRLRACTNIIKAKRIRIRQNRPAVEEAVDEIVAYPHAQFDDHVDTLTNFLLAIPEFIRKGLAPSRRLSSQSSAIVLSRGSVVSTSNVGAIARARSIFDRRENLPDLSNSETRSPMKPGEKSPYAAKEDSTPVFGFDGTKMVRLK